MDYKYNIAEFQAQTRQNISFRPCFDKKQKQRNCCNKIERTGQACNGCPLLIINNKNESN